MTAEDNNDNTQPATNTGGSEGPSFSVLSQYVKDLSFENPHAPNKPAESKDGSNIDVQVNVGTTPLHDDAHEVTLNFRVEAKTGENTLFIVELVYAGVFKIVGLTQETLRPALLIEAPRHLFPFARQIIAEVTQNSGYPTLMLDPINFAGLYQQGEARAAQEGAEAGNQPN